MCVKEDQSKEQKKQMKLPLKILVKVFLQFLAYIPSYVKWVTNSNGNFSLFHVSLTGMMCLSIRGKFTVKFSVS